MNMTKEEFYCLKEGQIIINKRSKIKYHCHKWVEDGIMMVINLKYINMLDFVNENTCENYEVATEDVD